VARPALEVADIFRDHGAAWRHANRGHVSLLQLKVMSAIENCRTAALGGHVARCEDCAHTTIAYNSLPQPALPEVPGRGSAPVDGGARGRTAADPLLPCRLHAPLGDWRIAYQNKAVIYDCCSRPSSETMLTIAADPKHLGARIGITSVLHSWGSGHDHHHTCT